MSIQKKRDGVWLIRWREGGRNRSLQVHGSHELARKIEHKKLATRDENRHLDVRREVNFRHSRVSRPSDPVRFLGRRSGSGSSRTCRPASSEIFVLGDLLDRF